MTLKKTILCSFLVCGMAANARIASLPDGMMDNFTNPPESAGVRVWWHWMNGNVSKDGIRKDIEWMHRSGITGFMHFDVGRKNYPDMIEHKMGYMSDEWKDAVRYAISIADSLGMEVAVASSPGWSATGGPWVKPENAMKKLVWSTTEIEGGRPVRVKLPAPLRRIGRYQDAISTSGKSWYTDVAVIAMKIREGDKNAGDFPAKVTSSGGEFALDWLTDGHYDKSVVLPRNNAGKGWLQYEFTEPRTFSSLTLGTNKMRTVFSSNHADVHYYLQCSDDGKKWTKVCDIPDGLVPSMTVNFPPVTARFFRLFMRGIGSDHKGRNISEFNLFALQRIQHSEEKAGFASPNDLPDFPTEGDIPSVACTDVIDVSAMVSGEILEWTAPEGQWRIYRFGANQTGARNSPAATDATGWEVDKLDPKTYLDYYRYYYDTFKEATGGLVGKRGIQFILNDSFEKGQSTWVAGMADYFRKRNGYDLAGWMPVLTGEIVGSVEQSERFLFDWRSTIAALYKDNYDNLQTIVDEYGFKGRYTEAHEVNRVYIADGMDLKRNATIPMSAFWLSGGFTKSPYWADIRESASVAHLYGQNIAAAESFTIGTGVNRSAYSKCPENLKPYADHALAQGLTRFVIHESAHQPDDSKVPGAGLFKYGLWFNRNETWADYAKVWIDYLARSCWMLQQGKPVADVLVYYGEDNCITGLYAKERPAVPAGYEFDFVNPTAILEDLHAEDGMLVSPSGLKYHVLLLDRNCGMMSAKVLRKIKEFADAGVQICGEVPSRPASLSDDDNEFRELVKDIWMSGRTNISKEAQEALSKAGISKDFVSSGTDVRYVHRALPDGTDIYWVRSFAEEKENIHFVFRSTNKYATVLDPVKVSATPVSVKSVDGFASVDLELDVNDAMFIVLSANGSEPKAVTCTRSDVKNIEGPWKLSFQEGRGAPAKATFKTLIPLDKSEKDGIRYFSGKVTYTTTFKLSSEQITKGASYVLSLGDVKNIADVSLNGKSIAVLWKAPFETEVTDALLPGKNTLTVTVANLWVNRIIGDARAEEDARHYTWTPQKFYDENGKLLPSGLIGPVKIEKVTKD